MKRSRVLLLLFVMLLIAVWYAWKETPRQQRVVADRAESQERLTVTTQNSAATGVPTLNFNDAAELSYKTPKRDLFRPLYRSPVVVYKPVEPPKPAPVVKLPTPPPPPPPPPQPVIRTTDRSKPIPPLNVLGFLQKENVLTVFLTSRTGELYLVQEGERFADGLLVRELDETKVVISWNKTDAGVTLQVGEKKNQRMAVPRLQSGRPSVPEINLNIPDTEPPTPAPTEEGGNK